ncbi:glycosyltransferase [Deinococcus peraridilitoris]|uniref:Putative glycosyltransferase n=1 Tax=Deinococcus peraridilitoris (strain DSM 19664 / LMG 22246 / CIP 109416 / KR-200) TaxID=937777 RepID=K9ZY23_DEIPD|nr:glycosyltransferase [Deinococcus peraridilitoris]AFZ66506.1 putative glycosyltransferase [Deinococcus peraridilitoris DSM 19664]
MNVAAVMVTYNRIETLKRALSALSCQSVPLDHIVIVNNGSSDGTTEFLDAAAKTDSRLHIINTGANLGGAGGFKAGVLYASALPVESLWLMDDDIIAAPDCLQHLLDVAATGYLVVQPARIQLDGTEFPTEEAFNFSNPLRHPTRPRRGVRKGAVREIITIPFEGPLIRKEVFLRTGLPDESFFILCDDLNFAIQCHLSGIRIAYAAEARMQRAFDHQAQATLTWKSYYEIRNLIEIDQRYAPKSVTVARAFKLLVKFTGLCLKNQDWPGLQITMTAVWHGLRRQRGKTVEPGPWKGWSVPSLVGKGREGRA